MAGGTRGLPDPLGGQDQEHRVPVWLRGLLLLPLPALGHHGQLYHVLRHPPLCHDAGGLVREESYHCAQNFKLEDFL